MALSQKLKTYFDLVEMKQISLSHYLRYVFVYRVLTVEDDICSCHNSYQASGICMAQA